MTSPYLNLPKRTIAEARAERGMHPADVYRLDVARAKKMQAKAIIHNVTMTTPTPRDPDRWRPWKFLLMNCAVWAVIILFAIFALVFITASVTLF
jgi:hypothetical protein